MGKRWRTLDPLAVEFCKSLLQVDPSKRPSAREAMSHPWLVKHCGHPPPQRSRLNVAQSIIMVPTAVDDEAEQPPTLIGSSTLGSESFDSLRTANSGTIAMDAIPEKPKRKSIMKRWFSASSIGRRAETEVIVFTSKENKSHEFRQKTEKTRSEECARS